MKIKGFRDFLSIEKKIFQNFFQKPLDKRKIFAIIKVQKKETNKKCLKLSKNLEKRQCTTKRWPTGSAKCRRDTATVKVKEGTKSDDSFPQRGERLKVAKKEGFVAMPRTGQMGI